MPSAFYGTPRVSAKKSPAIGSRFMPGFCSAWAGCGRTLKASHNIAQGKRSGVAAKRHPGVRVQRPCFNPVKVASTVVEPFQGSQFFLNRQPRAALRLPWAMLLNRFAVEALQWYRDENHPIVRTCFPSFGATFLPARTECACRIGNEQVILVQPIRSSKPRTGPRFCTSVTVLYSNTSPSSARSLRSTLYLT